MSELAQDFLFVDGNSPGVYYHGNIAHMRGLEIEGGNPFRCYSMMWHCLGWIVEPAPRHWFELCEQEAIETDAPEITTLGAWAWGTGHCIHDILKDSDTTYPLMRWGTTHVMQKDRDLVFMVPLIECDPYGEVTDPDYPELKEHLRDSVFVEDTERQDHLRAYIGNGTWVHRTDLVGLDRDSDRDRIVLPCQQALSDMLEEVQA
jgi:hypothetical protein